MSGVLVKTVVDGQLGESAGLAPGDVIVAADKEAVNTVQDLASLMLPRSGIPFNLSVRRGQHALTAELRPMVEQGGRQQSVATDGGIAVTDLSQGYLVETVARESRASRSGLKEGDRVLLTDGKAPRGAAAVHKVLSDESGDPMFLVVQRGSRKVGIFLK